MSQYDIVFTFANQRFGEICSHNMHIILYPLSLLVVLQCVTVMNLTRITALQVRRPEQNTSFNAKIEQFITAKLSGNALKQGSRTHALLSQRSSQLQKYKDAHSNNGVKLPWQGSSQMQKHEAARMSRRIAVEQRMYATGMADT